MVGLYVMPFTLSPYFERSILKNRKGYYLFYPKAKCEMMMVKVKSKDNSKLSFDVRPDYFRLKNTNPFFLPISSSVSISSSGFARCIFETIYAGLSSGP